MGHEAFFRLSYGLYIVSTHCGDKKNGYVSNTVFQVSSNPETFAVCCCKENFTAGMIKDSNVFSVSVLERYASAELIGTFGYKSGKDIDKFKDVEYTTKKTGTPIVLDNCIAWFECRVNQTVELNTHIMFIGEVVNYEMIDECKIPLTYEYYRDTRKGLAPKNAPTFYQEQKTRIDKPSKKHRCTICGYLHDSEKEKVDFEDLAEDWCCPICAAPKDKFETIIENEGEKLWQS